MCMPQSLTEYKLLLIHWAPLMLGGHGTPDVWGAVQPCHMKKNQDQAEDSSAVDSGPARFCPVLVSGAEAEDEWKKNVTL